MVQGKSRCPPHAVKPDGTDSEAVRQVEGALKRALIEEALRSLDREQRDVLVALHYRRVPVSELAMHLNIPTGTVNTRALSALKAIHRFLNESPQPGPGHQTEAAG
jgi:DNA-directed RNA polymerase specialized sigma24 family protein